MILLVILCGFAWAWGGEKYFGKWRRGVLVAIPFIIAGLLKGFGWMYFVGITILIWPVYQCLFYGACIHLIWPSSGEELHPDTEFGIMGLMVNGLMISTMPILYCIYEGNMYKAIVMSVICIVGFPFVCWLSNRCKFSFPGDIRIWEVKIYCPSDAWWLAELCVGGCLGICFIS